MGVDVVQSLNAIERSRSGLRKAAAPDRRFLLGIENIRLSPCRRYCVLDRGGDGCFMDRSERGNIGVVLCGDLDAVALRERLELTARLCIPFGLVCLTQPRELEAEGTTLVIHKIVLPHEIARHEIAARHAGDKTVNASPDPKLICHHAPTCSGRECQCKPDEPAGRRRSAVPYSQHLPLRAMG